MIRQARRPGINGAAAPGQRRPSLGSWTGEVPAMHEFQGAGKDVDRRHKAVETGLWLEIH